MRFISLLTPPVLEDDSQRQAATVRAQLRALGRDHVAVVASPEILREAGVALTGADHEPLPAGLLSPRLSRLKSRWKLQTHVRTRRVPELEHALASALDRLRARHDVTAILAPAESPMVTQLARRQKLPVVYSEDPPAPAWSLARVDARLTPRRVDITQRFRTFCWQRHRAGIPLVSREAMWPLIGETPMPATTGGRAPFRVGIALEGGEADCVQRFSAADLVSMTSERFAARDILIRHAASARWHFSPACGTSDRAGTPAAFVSQCERVVTVSSPIALEAMLMGKPALVIGDTPLRLASDKSFDEPIDRRQQLLALNFLAFVVYAPADLRFDAAYLGWRLGQPPEVEIFQRHLDWHRDQRDRPALRRSA